MKISFTLDEVRDMVLREASVLVPSAIFPQKVRFVHRHSDGSGEMEVEDITSIDRIEVEFPVPEESQ